MTVSPKYSVSVVYKNIYLTSTCFEIGQDLIELQHNIDFHVCIDHRQGVVFMYTKQCVRCAYSSGDFTMVACSKQIACTWKSF